jgi:hypothetical protein
MRKEHWDKKEKFLDYAQEGIEKNKFIRTAFINNDNNLRHWITEIFIYAYNLGIQDCLLEIQECGETLNKRLRKNKNYIDLLIYKKEKKYFE